MFVNLAHKRSYYIVNAITFYRLLTAPLLLTLLFYERLSIFKWLLIVSFLTDAVDGHLARKFKVTSAFGSILDSVSDDLTIAVAIIGIVLVNPAFLRQELVLVVIQVFLFSRRSRQHYFATVRLVASIPTWPNLLRFFRLYSLCSSIGYPNRFTYCFTLCQL
ncbi:CDP-alcohol phosphatidyltransferase family protein [Mucilaginibacter sp. P25]|uniref:CDP-alcohol phosphatidyltransferase family protein n=1 Tax=Mucilaginibacter sp. P25 TaxID=3423945 RepID=UPI003D7B66B3